MNRRRFLKSGALWVPPLFAIGRARGQALTLADPAMVGRTRPVASSACATSDTSIPHDELLEGFQTATTGYENTWSQTGTTANITAAADSTALSSGKPTGACNQAWKLTIPSDGTETFAKWERSTVIEDNVNIDCVFYLYADGDPASGKSIYPISIDGEYDELIVRLQILNNSGTIIVRAQTGTSSNFVSWSPNTWHKLAFHFDSTPTSSTLTLDDGSPESFTRLTGTYKKFKAIRIGAPYFLAPGDADGVNLWFDLICVNTP